jgi:hypothetical protein
VFVDFGTTRATYETFVDGSHNFDLTGPESVLRALTADDLAIDFAAQDVGQLADGATVGDWVARRGGLTASATGSPTYTAPDSDLGVPSVAYASTGDRHVASAVDWSTYNVATLLTVWRTDLTAPLNGGIASLHADLAGYPATNGGVEHLLGGSSLYWTALHYPDGAGSYWLERDQIADDGATHVNVSVHDTAAASTADEIRGYQDGVEIVGSTTGSSGNGKSWHSTLYPVLGARGPNAVEGLDGRLARFVAIPRALSADEAVQASNVLTRLAKAV